jgi:hypothetical protein
MSPLRVSFFFFFQLISFHDISYERYSGGGCLEAVLVNFLLSVVTLYDGSTNF